MSVGLLTCSLLTTAAIGQSSDNTHKQPVPAIKQVNPQQLNIIAQATQDIAESYFKMGWFSGSVLVAKDGGIILEKSYGFSNLKTQNKNTRVTKFNLGSIMKNFTRVLVLQQIQHNALSLNDTLDKFKLGFKEDIATKITIKHLLNHTSGFPDIFTAGYRENQLGFDTLNKKLELHKNTPLLFEPGSDSKYSNYGYIVLGAILEKVTGSAFEQLLVSKIFKPLALNNTSFKVNALDGNQSIRYTYLYDGSLKEVGVTEHPSPDGGIESTPADVLTFYRELFYGDKLLDRSHPTIRAAFNMDGEHWGAYGGGLGVSSAVEINLVEGIEIVVLANTDHLVAELISGRVHSFIKTGSYQSARERAINYAYRIYKEQGKNRFYKNFKQHYEQDGYTQFIGRTINELGMQLMDTESWNEAFDIFNYLVATFPEAPQAYDSLAFAHLSKGETAMAKTIFEKALAINPNFNSDYVSDNYGHSKYDHSIYRPR
ncbi:serine hydrolase [Aliikangiella marina]|uniref:Serine hydrolase n=2 Tax=Aliikangiella marina TaxID=1712262 RepID=A0A545TK20_9GAMM|nr:serine hydrolase [Aliikangiella marina]